MIDLEKRINAFARLGDFLLQFGLKKDKNPALSRINDHFYEKMEQCVTQSFYYNGWFTPGNVRFAISSWGEVLRKEHLEQWLAPYQQLREPSSVQNTITVIMAGNIPMVGFHDFLCILLSGNKLKVKLSSDDRQLIPLIYSVLSAIEPAFEDSVTFVDQRVGEVEAVIATGSNNSARYFEQYFGKYPHLIRKNRNGVAVLTGRESKDELHGLGHDVFQYFGLGCRNVSKLWVPKGYNFDDFFGAMLSYDEQVMQHNKYLNNYDYYRAIYMMNKHLITENGFLILKEDTALGSPVSVLFYEYYDNPLQLSERLKEASGGIQCVVASHAGIEGSIPFGSAQQPQLWDYADGVDTMDFLLKLGQGTNS